MTSEQPTTEILEPVDGGRPYTDAAMKEIGEQMRRDFFDDETINLMSTILSDQQAAIIYAMYGKNSQDPETPGIAAKSIGMSPDRAVIHFYRARYAILANTILAEKFSGIL